MDFVNYPYHRRPSLQQVIGVTASLGALITLAGALIAGAMKASGPGRPNDGNSCMEGSNTCPTQDRPAAFSTPRPS